MSSELKTWNCFLSVQSISASNCRIAWYPQVSHVCWYAGWEKSDPNKLSRILPGCSSSKTKVKIYAQFSYVQSLGVTHFMYVVCMCDIILTWYPHGSQQASLQLCAAQNVWPHQFTWQFMLRHACTYQKKEFGVCTPTSSLFPVYFICRNWGGMM